MEPHLEITGGSGLMYLKKRYWDTKCHRSHQRRYAYFNALMQQERNDIKTLSITNISKTTCMGRY
jgi:hypothetical protein